MTPAADGLSPSVDLSRVLTPHGGLVEELDVEDVLELAVSYAFKPGAGRHAELLLEVHDIRARPGESAPAIAVAQSIMRVVLARVAVSSLATCSRGDLPRVILACHRTVLDRGPHRIMATSKTQSRFDSCGAQLLTRLGLQAVLPVLTTVTR